MKLRDYASPPGQPISEGVEWLLEHELNQMGVKTLSGVPLPLTPDHAARVLAKALRDLGGPGSGNFGHAGRPGQVGGSASNASSGAPGGDDVLAYQRERVQRRQEGALEKRAEDVKRYGKEAEKWSKTPYDEWGAKNIDEYVANVDAKLEEVVPKSKVFVRMNSGDLQDVLKSGEVQNVFQSGRTHAGTTAAGKPDTERRRYVEEKLHDIPTTAGGDERPKYGYLSSGDGLTEMQPGVLQGAGMVAVQMKDSVKERTTFTIDDSADMAVTLMPEGLGGGWVDNHVFKPQPMLKPNIKAVPGGLLNNANTAEKMSDSYTEAQIHGRVRLSDIKSVTFGTKPGAGMISKLKKAGIPFKVANVKKARRFLGGPGSGNFGHAGRPGQVGGSAGNASSGGFSQSLDKPGVDEKLRMQFDGREEKRLADNMATLRTLAKEHDFPLDKLIVKDYDRKFNVGNKAFSEGGNFNPVSGEITINAKSLAKMGPAQTEALFAHEVMHRDWHDVTFSTDLDFGDLEEEMQDLRPEAQKAVVAVYDAMESSFDELAESDGTTPYSKAYWDLVPQRPDIRPYDDPEYPWLDHNTGELFMEKPKDNFAYPKDKLSSAINETLAEISSYDVMIAHGRREYAGKKPAANWRKLHTLVKETAKKVRADLR